MRRVFVIFLILLFPLNVLALSMSASSMQQASVAAPSACAQAAAGDFLADSASTGPSDGQAGGDIDPDEPPSSGDFHEPVDQHGGLRLPLPPAGPLAPYAPPLHDHPSFAPIKPPPKG